LTEAVTRNNYTAENVFSAGVLEDQAESDPIVNFCMEVTRVLRKAKFKEQRKDLRDMKSLGLASGL
jgi:hypothetical protein